MVVDDVRLEFPKPFHNFIRVLCPREYAPYKPGVGLVHRNSLLGPLCLAYHQGLLVNLLKVSVYVQGVGGNAPDAAVNVRNLHVAIRIPLKCRVVNFALHGLVLLFQLQCCLSCRLNCLPVLPAATESSPDGVSLTFFLAIWSYIELYSVQWSNIIKLNKKGHKITFTMTSDGRVLVAKYDNERSEKWK